MKSKNEMAQAFSVRVGVPVDKGYLSEFVELINGFIDGDGSYFILKADGGRRGARLTFVFCDRVRDVIFRRDTSSIEDGMMYIFAGLEEAGGYA